MLTRTSIPDTTASLEGIEARETAESVEAQETTTIVEASETTENVEAHQTSVVRTKETIENSTSSLEAFEELEQTRAIGLPDIESPSRAGSAQEEGPLQPTSAQEDEAFERTHDVLKDKDCVRGSTREQETQTAT